jgi:hypothetical protein
MDEAFHREVIDRLARIEVKMERIAAHDDRLGRVEAGQMKLENSSSRFTALAAVFGVLGASIVAAFPILFRHG